MIRKIVNKMSTRKLVNIVYKCFIISIIGMLISFVCMIMGKSWAGISGAISFLIVFFSVFVAEELDKQQSEKRTIERKKEMEEIFKEARKVRLKIEPEKNEEKQINANNVLKALMYYLQQMNGFECKAFWQNDKILLQLYLADEENSEYFIWDNYETFFDFFEIIE